MLEGGIRQFMTLCLMNAAIHSDSNCCVRKLGVSALVNILADAATTNRVPDDHARQSESTALENLKVYFHAGNSCLLLAHSIVSNQLYSLVSNPSAPS
jgi:hypothetical protein